MSTSRRAYVIDVRTQGPFILKICSAWTGGVILLCLLLHFFADEELGRSFYSVHLRIRNTWRILLPAVVVSGGISFFATIAATIWLSIRESHRLGGPVFKFTRLFRALEEGSFESDFRFRDGDLLVPLGESYRTALAANRERIAALRDLSRRAEARLGNAQIAIRARHLPPEEIALLDETADLVARVRQGLQAFHLGSN